MQPGGLLRQKPKVLTYTSFVSYTSRTTGVSIIMMKGFIKFCEIFMSLKAGQLAGFVEQFHGMTYATIKGAGHMVRALVDFGSRPEPYSRSGSGLA